MKELNIASNNLCYPDLSGVTAIISKAIPTMGALTSLIITNNCLGSEGASTLAEAVHEAAHAALGHALHM